MLSVHKDIGVKWTWDHNLRDINFVNELEQAYYSFLISNYGPSSCLSLIENSAGSSYLTSSSSTWLKHVSFSHPCFKFINALISSQNKCHGVHGVFMGILCSGLLLQGLKTEKKLSHRVLREVSEWIQLSLLEKLQQNYGNISCKHHIGTLNEMLCVTRTVIKSKSFYCVSEEECEHLSRKIIEAFLETLPDEKQKDFGKIHVFDIEGASPLDSNIVNGILYRVTDYSIEELRHEIKVLEGIHLKIIIFTIPLSHESNRKDVIEWNSNSPLKSSFCFSVFKMLTNLLKEKGIKVIASQMYVHEELKCDLRKEGFLILERLGTSLTDSLVKVINCSPVTSLYDLQFRIDHHIGLIPAIEAKIIGKSTYLHIHSQVPPQDLSFILMAESIHALAFLEESVNTGISLLKEMIKNPRLVSGAGCFEVFIASLLTKMKAENFVQLSQLYNTSCANIIMMFDEYIEAFLRLSVLPCAGKLGKLIDFYTDSEVFHLWKASSEIQEQEKNDDVFVHENVGIEQECACKCISKCDLSDRVRFISLYNFKNSNYEAFGFDFNTSVFESTTRNNRTPFRIRPNSIVDSYSAKVNAIRFAFDGFSELLRLGLCIYNN